MTTKSKKLDVENLKQSGDPDVPHTKVARELTGDDYRESLLTTADLEQKLGERKGIIPMRPRVFRIADGLIEKLNQMQATSEKNPLSQVAARLDQMHHHFGTENIIDLAMILANMQLRKEEKEMLKKLTGDGGLINLDKVKDTVTPSLLGSTATFKQFVDDESVKNF